jgi:hypothetical protein
MATGSRTLKGEVLLWLCVAISLGCIWDLAGLPAAYGNFWFAGCPSACCSLRWLC